MPARVMAMTVASPDRIRAASSAQAVAGTPPSPGPSSGRQDGELGEEAGERRQPREQQRAADEAEAQDRHGRRDGDADLLLLVQLVLLALAERFPRHGQHVRADLAAALDELDQQEEGGDREDELAR